MIFFIDEVISKEDCEILTKLFFKEKETMLNIDGGEYAAAKFSFGFEPKLYDFNKYLDILKPKILEYYNVKTITNVNSYVRCYYNGAELEKHVDRPDIGITLSICLNTTINKQWGLCAEIDNSTDCYNTDIGQGVLLIDSNKYTHWRDKLECGDDEYVLQFFLHWTSSKTTTKETHTLI